MRRTGRPRGLWKVLERAIGRTPGAGRAGLWHGAVRTAGAATGREGLWAELKTVLPFENFRPRRMDGFESRELRGRDGRPFRMLHNPERWTYYHLPEDCWALWDLMDGTRTTADLYLASYERTGKLLAYRKFMVCLQGLHEKGFLVPPPRRVFGWLLEHAVRRTAWQRLRAVYDRRLSIHGLDPLFTRIHRALSPLYNQGVRSAAYALIVLGVVVFARSAIAGDYGLLSFQGSYAAGLLVLLALQLAITALHELGHALSMKAIGRRVDEAGVHISLPVPGAFVNTNDIHLVDDPGRRVAVSWAGPFTDLFVAGLCGAGILLAPGSGLASILYKTAFLNYLGVFINLDPCRPTDGHYMLVDWLGINNLLGKVSEYLRLRFLRQLLGKEPMSREDRVLAVVGVLGWAWKILAGAAILGLYAFLLVSLWRTLIDHWPEASLATRAAFVLLAVVTAAPIAYGAAVRGRKIYWRARFALDRVGFFRRDRYVYAWSAGTAVLMAAWPLLGGPVAWFDAYAGWLSAAVFALASLLAIDLFGWQGGAKRASLLCLGFWAAASIPLSLAGAQAAWSGPLELAGAAALFLAGYLSVQAARGRLVLPIAVGAVLLVPAGSAAWMALELSARGAPYGDALVFGWSRALGETGVLLLAAGLVLLAGSPLAVPFAIAVAGIGCVVAAPVLEILGIPSWGGPLLSAIGCGLFLVGLGLTRRAFARIESVEPRLDGIGYDDPAILFGATVYVVECLLLGLRRFYGPSHFGTVESRLNQRLLEDGLRFTVLHGRVRSTVRENASLADASRQCVPLLEAALAQASWLCGPRALDRILTRIYDRLFWEERELLGHHVFGSPQWAGSWTEKAKPAHGPQELLRANPLFAHFSDAEIADMVRVFRVREAEPGEVLIRQGQEATQFFLIASGRVEVLDEAGGLLIATLEEGEPFGEMALTESGRCLATCASVGRATLYALEREDFRAANRLRDAKTGEMLVRTKGILRLLASVPIFGEAGPEALTRLVQELRVEPRPAGSVVVREGELGDEFYLVYEGRLAIHQRIDGQERKVREIAKGEFFGEIALIQDCPRTATVTAETDVTLLVLSREAFREIVLDSLDLGERILTISTRHLRAADRLRRQEAATDRAAS